MDGNLQKSPQLGCPDELEAKYISGLSTILVATIQEAKDRISQIEYIFCSQIYSHFQAKWKTLQKLYSEAREAAENACKEKERDMLLQIEKLQLEKQQLCDEIRSLKLERENFTSIGLSPDSIRGLQDELSQKTKEIDKMRLKKEQWRDMSRAKDSVIEDRDKELKELDDKYEKLFVTHMYLEREVKELKSELANKNKEVDAGIELQNKLLQMVQSNTSVVADSNEQLNDHEEKAKVILSRVGTVNNKIDKLQEELRKKSEEVDKAKEVRDNLLKKVECQASEIVEYDQRFNKFETEKRLLALKLENLQNDINLLQQEIQKKNDEVAEGRKLQQQLIQQIDLYNIEKLKAKLEFEELAKEKQQLLAKIGGSEEKVEMLQTNLQEGSQESSEDMELHGKLLQQIEAKDSQIMSEKQKRRDVVVAYKKLKSQYLFLCSKYGLTTENALCQNKLEDESNFLGPNQSPLTSADVNKAPNVSDVTDEAARETGEVEKLENDKGARLIQRSNSVSPSTSKTFVQPKAVASVKSCPPTGTKRPVSYWRDTRSHQSRLGPDPHDDFLDTPLEKIRGNLGNAMKNEICNPPEPAPKEKDFDSSDDETQDMNVDHGPEKHEIPPSRPGSSNFKYVEPVRKKTARENLKGIECKQCKKFYDAVLPSESKDANGNEQNLRCEHHDGVSRHRYRYAPPLTPEGFWNIGFESEM